VGGKGHLPVWARKGRFSFQLRNGPKREEEDEMDGFVMENGKWLLDD
jgi:hypothetical protein